MNDSIKRISLDIHNTSSGEAVNAKRGDTGRRICISLVDGGVPYIIDEDCYAVFTAKKPDGNIVFNDCTIVKNMIIYSVTEQTVAVEGRVNCEIKLYGSDAKLITSPKFTILVSGTVYNEGDEVESTDEFSALTTLISEVQELRNSAAGRIVEVDLPASAWEGSDNLYSQVVTIEGVTEYSKVDLLPSVEQLAIFHQKDIAFVTENEDGVVTVYIIGDKPTGDYTMQAQITEVAA